METLIIVGGFIGSAVLLRLVFAALVEMTSPHAELRAARRKAELETKKRVMKRKLQKQKNKIASSVNGSGSEAGKNVPHQTKKISSSRHSILQ